MEAEKIEKSVEEMTPEEFRAIIDSNIEKSLAILEEMKNKVLAGEYNEAQLELIGSKISSDILPRAEAFRKKILSHLKEESEG